MHQASLLLSVLSSLLASPDAPRPGEQKTYAVQTVKDIAYYDGPDQHKVKHKLDLYLPKGLKDFPVLFFVHGGAWVHGDKDMLGLYGLFASAYARQGIGVAVTNYRLSPDVKHPEHIKDVARAFAWVHKNVAKHGGRPDRVFACGHSAGAHLVSLLAGDAAYLKDHGLTSAAIRGVIPISGPFVLEDGWLPKVFGSEKGTGKKVSPISYAREKMPPFLILFADKDLPSCGKMTAEAYCKAVKGKGNLADLVEITGSDHIRIMVSAGNAKDKVFESITKFIRANTDK
jgi:acetyl esterase/lipase